jgi:phenylacetate-CoA ligase
MADATVVEILDPQGNRVPDGETGEIVITDLYSREIPFIRYATGDLGAMSPGRCACGRALPMIGRIQGRTTDFIVAPDGTILHALSVIYILRELDGVEQFRIRQKAVDRLHIELVRNTRFRPEYETRIREGLRKRLRADIEVGIEYLAALPPERSGKFRHVISEVPMDEILRAKSVPAGC